MKEVGLEPRMKEREIWIEIGELTEREDVVGA